MPYDYKKPRSATKVISSSSSRASRKKPLPSHRISVKHVAKRKVSRSPRQSNDTDWRLVASQIVIGIAAVSLIIMVLIYVALTQVAPTLLPLRQSQTLVLVTKNSQDSKTGQTPVAAEVFTFDPSSHLVSATSVSLQGNSDAQPLAQAVDQRQRGWVSLHLGKLVDEVALVDTDTPAITNRSTGLHQLRSLIMTKTPGLSTTDKLRWWLYGITLPDSRWQLKTADSLPQLEDWITKLSRPIDLHCTVALINTTTVTGLSNNMSNVLEQSGYQVVRVDSQPLIFQLSQFMVSPSAPSDCQPLITRLNELLPAPVHQEVNTIFQLKIERILSGSWEVISETRSKVWIKH